MKGRKKEAIKERYVNEVDKKNRIYTKLILFVWKQQIIKQIHKKIHILNTELTGTATTKNDGDNDKGSVRTTTANGQQ